MLMTRFWVVLLATYLLAPAGCADNGPTDTTMGSAMANSAGSMPGSGGANTQGGQDLSDANGSSGGGSSATGSSTGGSSTGGSSTGGSSTGGSSTGGATQADAGTTNPTPTGCQDNDKGTRGNTCPGVVTCGTVEACSLTTQNCCVSDYKADAASCNEGTTCKGLVSAACDGPEDCGGGQVCCISVSLTTSAPFAAIQHRCVADAKKCTGGSLVNRLLCHTDAQCAAGEGCEAIGNLPWWGICKK